MENEQITTELFRLKFFGSSNPALIEMLRIKLELLKSEDLDLKTILDNYRIGNDRTKPFADQLLRKYFSDYLIKKHFSKVDYPLNQLKDFEFADNPAIAAGAQLALLKKWDQLAITTLKDLAGTRGQNPEIRVTAAQILIEKFKKFLKKTDLKELKKLSYGTN